MIKAYKKIKTETKNGFLIEKYHILKIYGLKFKDIDELVYFSLGTDDPEELYFTYGISSSFSDNIVYIDFERLKKALNEYDNPDYSIIKIKKILNKYDLKGYAWWSK